MNLLLSCAHQMPLSALFFIAIPLTKLHDKARIIPSAWKCNIILYKAGGTEEPGNYFPISVIPINVVKVLEKIIDE